MFTIIHGDGTDGTTVGAGTIGVGPVIMAMVADGMILTGAPVGVGTTGVGMQDGAGPDIMAMAVDGTIHTIITMAGTTGIMGIQTAEGGITGMLLQLPQTGHIPGTTITIEEIQILPITEGVQTRLITGEVQIPHTIEEATTIVIILPGETVATQTLPMAIVEGSIQILPAPVGITTVEPADVQAVMLLKGQAHLQDRTHQAHQAAQGLRAEV